MRIGTTLCCRESRRALYKIGDGGPANDVSRRAFSPLPSKHNYEAPNIMKSAEETKALVLKAFDTLFNTRDYAKAADFWSETYIQHSAHIGPGRDGLFNLIRGLPAALRYESACIVAQGDYVMLHGRFSGHGLPRAWI